MKKKCVKSCGTNSIIVEIFSLSTDYKYKQKKTKKITWDSNPGPADLHGPYTSEQEKMSHMKRKCVKNCGTHSIILENFSLSTDYKYKPAICRA